MNPTLAESYRRCRQVARRANSNFYYSFLLLPRAKRRAMHALYAFARHTDDIGDSGPEAERAAVLERWRAALAAALAGDASDAILPALADTLRRWRIPPEYLTAILNGVAMDLEPTRYETFAQLEDYCYHVAAAVGLSCIHIWGFRDGAALAPARQCGVAFQLTNILRDVRADAEVGRCYLPLEDLRRFGCSPEDLRERVFSDPLRRLMQFQIQRAKRLYAEAAPLQAQLHPDGARIFSAMHATYRELLSEIERREGDVFTQTVSLSRRQKLKSALKLLRPGVRAPHAEAHAP